MRPPSPKFSGYLRHAAKDRGFAYFYDPDGKRRRRYFPGAYGSAESHRAFAAWLQEMERGHSGQLDLPTLAGPASADGPTFAELAIEYLRHCEARYRRRDGSQTPEFAHQRDALAVLLELFGDDLAATFGPRKLKLVRERMLRVRQWSRKTTNGRIRRIKQFLDWCVADELLPVTVAEACARVKSLRMGEAESRETEPVRAAPELSIRRALPHLSPPMQAALAVQVMTGCRPGELLQLCEDDIDRDGPAGCWVFLPRQHKLLHRRRGRRILIPPRAQAWLRPLLERHRGQAALFCPKDVRDGRDVRTHYTPDRYGRALVRACAAAGVGPFTGLNVRHTTATVLRREFQSIDMVAVVLGHTWAQITEVYAELPLERAAAELVRVPWSFVPDPDQAGADLPAADRSVIA